MSLIKVKSFFKQFNMDSRIIELDNSSATVELAALSLGCEPKRIAKTLGFLVNEEVILIVMEGDAKIDNHKFKDFFKFKAKMIPFENVLNLTGHEVGGVCPFAVNDGVKIYLDQSLKRFKTVFPACGSSNSAIEISLEELEKYSNYLEWIDACKEWNN